LPRRGGGQARASPLWIDRLVMLATGAPAIDDVLTFAAGEL
jgi:lysyl-tRNA synthetase class II